MDALDEGDVDLQLADRQFVQLGKGGVAGAEVVDGQGESGAHELAQAFFGTFDFQQRDRFGDFEDDRFGRNAMTGGVGDQPGDEFRCEQLAFGDVRAVNGCTGVMPAY